MSNKAQNDIEYGNLSEIGYGKKNLHRYVFVNPVLFNSPFAAQQHFGDVVEIFCLLTTRSSHGQECNQ